MDGRGKKKIARASNQRKKWPPSDFLSFMYNETDAIFVEHEKWDGEFPAKTLALWLGVYLVIYFYVRNITLQWDIT